MVTNSENHYLISKEQRFKRLFVFDKNEDKPLYYAFSLAVINLAIGYIATLDKTYLNYAIKYYDYLLSCGDQGIYNNYIGKFGIASALLSVLTEENKYSQMVEHVMDYFGDTQNEEGYWEEFEKDSILSFDRTSEFTASISLIKFIGSLNNFKVLTRKNEMGILR